MNTVWYAITNEPHVLGGTDVQDVPCTQHARSIDVVIEWFFGGSEIGSNSLGGAYNDEWFRISQIVFHTSNIREKYTRLYGCTQPETYQLSENYLRDTAPINYF